MAFASSVLLFGAVVKTSDVVVVGGRSVCRSLAGNLGAVLTLGAVGALPHCRGGHGVECWAPLEVVPTGL